MCSKVKGDGCKSGAVGGTDVYIGVSGLQYYRPSSPSVPRAIHAQDQTETPGHLMKKVSCFVAAQFQ